MEKTKFGMFGASLLNLLMIRKDWSLFGEIEVPPHSYTLTYPFVLVRTILFLSLAHFFYVINCPQKVIIVLICQLGMLVSTNFLLFSTPFLLFSTTFLLFSTNFLLFSTNFFLLQILPFLLPMNNLHLRAYLLPWKQSRSTSWIFPPILDEIFPNARNCTVLCGKLTKSM